MIKATKHLIRFELVTFGAKLPTGDYERGVSNIVEIDGNKRLTILNKFGHKEFIFKGSKAQTVADIGRLLIEASKLADKYEKFMNEADLIKP